MADYSIKALSLKVNLSTEEIKKRLEHHGIIVVDDNHQLNAKEVQILLQPTTSKKNTMHLSKTKKTLDLKSTKTPEKTKLSLTSKNKKIIKLDTTFSKKSEKKPLQKEPAPIKEKTPVKETAPEKVIQTPDTETQNIDTPTPIESSAEIQQKDIELQEPIHDTITLPTTIKASELAQLLDKQTADVIKISMLNLGAMITINQTLDFDTASLIANEFGFKDIEQLEAESETNQDHHIEELIMESDAEQVSRAPVVTIMGHVDHGKTTLLDYLRKSQITEKESGGITQHIGAYQVFTDGGPITFLDTPGHAAFTAMRARGSKVTDIVILIIAADDGIMPQTVEAIQHAKAAEVPIIVAITKIDKPGVDIQKVKTGLTTHDLTPEEWGGDTICISISAKTGEGIDDLLENVLLQAEMLELKTVATGPAKGVVLESNLDKGYGPVSTILVQNGTLNKGDILLVGKHFGKVRLLFNDKGILINNAEPSTPVKVIGLSGVTSTADEAICMKSEKQAKEIANQRQIRFRENKLAENTATTLHDAFSKLEKIRSYKQLKIILKSDTQGSSEAIQDALNKLSTNEVHINIIANNTGGINTSDVQLALAYNAIIIGFNVRADLAAKQLINTDNVNTYYFSVIYHLLDKVNNMVHGLKEPEKRETILGTAQVREIFRASKLGVIAGCMIQDGLIKKNMSIKLIRDQKVIFDGKVGSLRRHKDDVNEVKQGIECGIGIKDFQDIKVNDIIEAYFIEVIEPVAG